MRTNKIKKMHIYTIIVFIILIIIGLILSFSINATQSYKKNSAKNGILDLSDWEFEKQGTITLNGNWAFYWNKFATSDETPDMFVNVPSVWNSYKINGDYLPGNGYATYKLHVKNGGTQPLAIKFEPCSTAYELYIDDELVTKNGKIAKQKEDFIPEYKQQTITFTPNSNDFIITVYISNYEYARGGFWYAAMLGSPAQLEKINRFISYRDLLLIGSFLTMMIFCLFLYMFTQRNSALIIFTWLSFITALRTALYGDRIFIRLITSFHFTIICEYFTLIWMPILISLLIQSLIDNTRSKMISRIIISISVIESILVILLPISIITRFTFYIEIFGICTAIFSLINFLFTTKHVKYVLSVGTIVLIFCGIYDVLYQSCLVNGFFELSPIGFFVMLNTWVIILSIDYTNTIMNMEKSLEKAQEAEMAFLYAQIKPHFIYNSLNVIATLCKLDSNKAHKLTIDLSKYLQYTFQYKNLSKYIPFEDELDFVRTYVNIEKERFINSFEMLYDLCDISRLKVPPLSIQPLVENAIRHGIRKKDYFGTVILRVTEEPDWYLIQVIDNGVGIQKEQLEQLQNGLLNEMSGVGFFNVKKRIEQLYKTKLEIDSIYNQGTQIKITIPKEINTK